MGPGSAARHFVPRSVRGTILLILVNPKSRWARRLAPLPTLRELAKTHFPCVFP
ncbi:hypothetical protein ACVWYQ_004788 [Bradyrhizobium sp. USDA 3397]